ncbi:MAG: hypothetical protein ACI9JG_000398 [Alphaproteobacteria bacterium]|jgi:hypothetical protein
MIKNNINKYIDIYATNTYIDCNCYHSIIMSDNYILTIKIGDKHELSTIA